MQPLQSSRSLQCMLETASYGVAWQHKRKHGAAAYTALKNPRSLPKTRGLFRLLRHGSEDIYTTGLLGQAESGFAWSSKFANPSCARYDLLL